MAKCFRCESEIDTTGAVQFVNHNPTHSGTDACNNALLKDYQAKLEKVAQFDKIQQAEENARMRAAEEVEKTRKKAEQDDAIRKEAEEAKKAEHQPVATSMSQQRRFEGQGVGSAEQQQAKDEADRKAKADADADAAARAAQAKKNQEEKDRAAAQHK